MRRSLATLVIALCSMIAVTGTASAQLESVATQGLSGSTPIRVDGAVANPSVYQSAQLAAMPQTALSLGGSGRTVTGVLLTDLVTASSPVLGIGKNPQLRVSVTITGQFGYRLILAYGELDPGFGNHPALLVSNGRATTLIVPGDLTRLRTVPQVSRITVAVSAAGAAPVATPGSIAVSTSRGDNSLSATKLAQLPQRTLTVNFLQGTTPQQHTETGPTLFAVVAAAGALPLPSTTVTAVGSDGYGATVTIGEALFGSRPLLLSLNEDGAALAQPRLIVSGDVKGGRYISGVVSLVVGRGY